MSLVEERARPIARGESPVDLAEARALAKQVPEWTLNETSLTRDFAFRDFREAMAFTNRVAEIANAEDHHPDIAVSYNQVRLTLSTHKIGGLSRNDFVVAARIDAREKRAAREPLPGPGVPAHDSLRGETALVTGAGRRIGREIAVALAQEGVRILIHYNTSAAEAHQLQAHLDEIGAGSWLVKADLSHESECEGLIDRCVQVAGGLDILVNSASIFPAQTLKEASRDGLFTNIQLNAWAPFVLSRNFHDRVGRGNIINLLDSRIKGYDWMHVPYILSKHMLAVLTRMTALEYAPDIRVNGVAPGLILPPPDKDERYLDALTGSVPLKRHGHARDISSAVVFLLKSHFVTGQVVNVDGGRHLWEYGHGGPNPNQ
jgi:hypothetical protein